MCLTHVHRSEASLGFVLRLNCGAKPEGDAQPTASAREQLHCRLRLSIVWHSIAASLRCDFRHRCGHRCGQYRYCTRCTLLHPLRKPLRERRVED